MQWYELKQIASSIQFLQEEDTIIWQYNSSSKCSVQSLYVVVDTPVMWKISIPSIFLIFLWLLANNKILSRDNLAKRRKFENMLSLFCDENETANHLFFEYCVAHSIWEAICEICGK
jgi:hypothetical protein